MRAILHAHLIPKCPHADLFNQRGRAWLRRQELLDDERQAIDRHLRKLDRLGEDLAVLDREIAEGALDDGAVKRLMTITGVKLTVAASIMAAIGDIHRFDHPGKLVSYFGLNPRVRQSGLDPAHHGRISKVGRSHARAMLVEAAWTAAKAPGPLHAFFVRIRARRASDRCGGGCAQACGSVLACADERTGLSLRSAGACRQQDARHGAPGRAPSEERQSTGTGLRL